MYDYFYFFNLAAKTVTKEWTHKYFPQVRDKGGGFWFFSELPALTIMINIIQG